MKRNKVFVISGHFNYCKRNNVKEYSIYIFFNKGIISKIRLHCLFSLWIKVTTTIWFLNHPLKMKSKGDITHLILNHVHNWNKIMEVKCPANQIFINSLVYTTVQNKSTCPTPGTSDFWPWASGFLLVTCPKSVRASGILRFTCLGQVARRSGHCPDFFFLFFLDRWATGPIVPCLKIAENHMQVDQLWSAITSKIFRFTS